MAAPWTRPDAGILTAERWLGEDAQALVEGGDVAIVRQRLLRWQKRLGLPGERVTGWQRRSVAASLQASGVVADEAAVAGALEAGRERLASSLLPLERAHLLSARFTLRHRWYLDDLTVAHWVRDFQSDARRYAGEHNLGFVREFTAPERMVGSLGFSGHASIAVTGDAFELQRFIDDFAIYKLGGVRRGSLSGEYLRTIPRYDISSTVADPLVHVPDALLDHSRIGREERHDEVMRMHAQTMQQLEGLRERMQQRRPTSRPSPGVDRDLGAA